jgi:hypothetical protein
MAISVTPTAQSHDDSARFLSWIWAVLKSVDKAEAVAKTLLREDCKRRDSMWAWLK